MEIKLYERYVYLLKQKKTADDDEYPITKALIFSSCGSVSSGNSS